MKTNPVTLAAILACLPFATAVAQDAGEAAPPAITLQVDAGQVMTSDGGEFVSASSGAAVSQGQRVMVAEGGAARLVYDNGCEKLLSSPGVYTVVSDCDSGSAVVGGNGRLAAGVGGAVLVIAAIAGGGGGSDRPPPVSR